MIVVTRLNDSRFAVNPDLVERIHETPDTTLIMVDGAKYIVTESMAEVIALIAEYRARIVGLAYGAPAAQQPPAAHPGTGAHNVVRHPAHPARTADGLAPVADLADLRHEGR